MDVAEVAGKSPWIRKIWPVGRGELRKVLPLLILKFLVSVAYATLTCLKDTLVVTASHSGAEVIPVLKGWLVFPLSLLFAAVYSKLSNHLRRSTLFYSIITLFLLIIFLYGFVLYPNADLITPHRSADWLTACFGEKYAHWIAVYRNWFHSLFFLTAELWGQVVIFILYWGFVNHICQVKEAKRTYTLFIAAGDLATVAVGPLVLYHLAKFSGQNFTPALQSLLFYVLLCGVMIIALYWWMNRYVLSDTRFYDPSVMHSSVDQKTKLSLGKSIRHIFSSKYLLGIAVLVVGCAISINMIDLTWKAHLKQLYPTAAQYQAFVAKTTCSVGVVALITVFFFGGNFLRIFGWHFSAQIAPIVIGVTGVVFFLLSCFQKHCALLATLLGTTPLTFLVFFGAFQSVTSKVVKWSFFDSTKEMAYIPLDQESKVKGKATIDMVGSRFGKFTSSWTHIFIMAAMGTGSVLMITPYLIPIMIGVTCYWCYSVRYLSGELSKKEAAIAKRKTEVPIEEGLVAPSAAIKTGSI